MATRSALTVLRLGSADIDQLSRLVDRDPVVNVYLRSELRLGFESADWWGTFDGGELTAAVLGWSLVVPCIPDLDAAVPLAHALSTSAQPKMLVGPRDSVLALHRAFRPPRTARDIRDPQPMLSLDRGDLVGTPAPQVRPATLDDLDVLVIAAAAMHREEMGIDPLAIDAIGWRTRMTSLIDRGWSWVWTEGGEVVFKAELSAWTPEAVQIQGVYTAPRHRRRGVGQAGLAGVCAWLLEQVPRCTLYVNHYNVVARRMYQRLGFKPAATFATVIYP